jgi:hypothetical protein
VMARWGTSWRASATATSVQQGCGNPARMSTAAALERDTELVRRDCVAVARLTPQIGGPGAALVVGAAGGRGASVGAPTPWSAWPGQSWARRVPSLGTSSPAMAGTGVLRGARGSRGTGLVELERGGARVGMSMGDMAGMALPWLCVATF